MMSFLQFGVQPPTPDGVISIPKGELRVVNKDPHHQWEKGLIPIPTPQEEIIWVHPDLMEGQQWTTVTNKKSRGKEKASSCNMVCASSREAEADIPSLTDFEEDSTVLAVEPNALLVARTHSGHSYLKKYDEVVAGPSKPTQEPINIP